MKQQNLNVLNLLLTLILTLCLLIILAREFDIIFQHLLCLVKEIFLTCTAVLLLYRLIILSYFSRRLHLRQHLDEKLFQVRTIINFV